MSLQDTLERIQKTPGFYVKQNWEALEAVAGCCGYEQGNSYEVSNIPAAEYRDKGMEGDVKIMRAEEQTGCCTRCFCGENRGFTFNFQTPQSKETFVRLERSYRCCGWAVIPCCAHKVNVYSTVQKNEDNKLEVLGNSDDLQLAAQVKVPMFHGGGCMPRFRLYDENHKQTGYVYGYSCCCAPCVICDFCGANFFIHKNGQYVGKMEKKGVSSCKDYLYELHTDADKFTVEFEEDALKSGAIDVNFKLAVLATVLQIDFNFFEDKRGIKECRCCDIACCGYALPCIPGWCLVFCLCCKKKKEDKDDKPKVIEG